MQNIVALGETLMFSFEQLSEIRHCNPKNCGKYVHFHLTLEKILVGNLNENSGSSMDIILTVALLGIVSKMATYDGHVFSLIRNPFYFGEFATFSTYF